MLTYQKVSLEIVGFYRSPNDSTVELFCDILNDRFLPTIGSTQKLLFAGDAANNTVVCVINLLDGSASTSRLSDMFVSHYFTSLINIPTRVTDSSSTTVDHMWSNISAGLSSGVMTSDVTDHFTLFRCISNLRVVGGEHFQCI